MSLVGRRVSIASTSPPADATVSVCAFGAASPTSGILSSAGVDHGELAGRGDGLAVDERDRHHRVLAGALNGTCAA